LALQIDALKITPPKMACFCSFFSRTSILL